LLLAVMMATALGSGILSLAKAQGVGATQAANPRASFSATVATPVGAIVLVRQLGAPTSLPDGRIEQRIQVVANAPFVLSTVAGSTADVTWTDGQQERPLANFVGNAGVHTEIRVISRGDSAPQLGARAAAPAQNTSLGSRDSKL
jgi:hypothetical protein